MGSPSGVGEVCGCGAWAPRDAASLSRAGGSAAPRVPRRPRHPGAARARGWSRRGSRALLRGSRELAPLQRERKVHEKKATLGSVLSAGSGARANLHARSGPPGRGPQPPPALLSRSGPPPARATTGPASSAAPGSDALAQTFPAGMTGTGVRGWVPGTREPSRVRPRETEILYIPPSDFAISIGWAYFFHKNFFNCAFLSIIMMLHVISLSNRKKQTNKKKIMKKDEKNACCAEAFFGK